MEVEELRKRVSVLENDIAASVARLMSEFEKDTGYSPSGVLVDMCETTTLGSSLRGYRVCGCEVILDLFGR